MFTFSPLDTYKISHAKKEEKFILDYKVLLRLYEPIIGSIAMSLYLTLESEISLNKYSKVNLNISRLHKLLQINDVQFNEAVETLKQYKLITYKANQRKANDYLFVIYPTKSAFEFLSDNKLNNSLSVVVDESYYKQVYNYFISSAINEDEYVDIEDVKLDNNITIDEFFFQFYEKYPIISSSSCIDDKCKEEIKRLKKLFNLNYDELESALLKSFEYENQKMVVNLSKLNSIVSEKYKKEVVDNSDEAIIRSFDNIRSIAYYKQLSSRGALLPSETSMINELLDRYKISEGVLNVVINYYFKYGKNTFGNPKNYFIKVIEEMIINNVKTTLDAMNYFRNRNKKIKSYKDKINNENKIVETNNYKKEEGKSNEIDEKTLDEFLKAFGG